jgi:predicted dehydrogenase
MDFLNRREFFQDSALLAALTGAAALGSSRAAAEEEAKAAKKKGAANDRLNVAVIGVHGRGKNHVNGFAGKNNCVVATICDCDTDAKVIGGAMKSAEKAQGKAPLFVQDLRQVMDDKSIDIVSIATPNHWHALAAIWALQAGKDVYVEKPVSHNVSEGRRIVEAARKYNRICQAGTQSRSNSGMREAIEFIHAGNLGHIKLARGLCYKSRKSIGKVAGEQPIPKTIDYNLWCGPAPMKPLMREKLHYDWHWIWDYGNGDLGNQGIHEMDKARWGLGKSELPRAVASVGGRFGYVDDGQTANTQICVFDYGDSELIFEVRGLPTKPLLGALVGNIFYGTEGYLVCPSYKGGTAFTAKGEVIKKFDGGNDQHHYDNFVQAVRKRNQAGLNGDILEGHLSSALCHLGNVSYRLGTDQPFNHKSKAFGDDKDAFEAFARMTEHLKENKVALDGQSYRVGPKLAIDPKTETFVNNKAADAYLTREYRKPFVVPEQV